MVDLRTDIRVLLSYTIPWKDEINERGENDALMAVSY